MRRGMIRAVSSAPPLGGAVCGTPWERARPLRIACYPWHAGGVRPSTRVRLLYDDAGLYVQFRCPDSHSSARVTRLNGPVYRDSCVEFFANPHPRAGAEYFNLEINCCGVFHLGRGAGREGRRLIDPVLARRLRIVSSLPGPTKEESPADSLWWVAAALPFNLLSEFLATPLRPAPGDLWRANFYRCGGRTDPPYACWNGVRSPAPDFHRPESFGELRFG